MRFREKLYRFMYGRYGVDELYYFIFVLALVLSVVDFVLGLIFHDSAVVDIIGISVSIVVFVLFVWMISRFMSRNLYKRRKENERYLGAFRAVKRFLSFNTSCGSKSRNQDDWTYIFRDCTKCGSTLRLQRREGRHKVKCPRCSHGFYVKAKKNKR